MMVLYEKVALILLSLFPNIFVTLANLSKDGSQPSVNSREPNNFFSLPQAPSTCGVRTHMLAEHLIQTQ